MNSSARRTDYDENKNKNERTNTKHLDGVGYGDDAVSGAAAGIGGRVR